MMNRTLYALAVLMMLAVSACGTGHSAGNTPVDAAADTVPAGYSGQTNPLSTEAAAAGMEIYATNCAMCHGPEGRGDGPAGASLIPPPRNLAEVSQTTEDDFLYWRIAEGKPGTSMMPWKGILEEDQIWQLVSHIRTLK